MRRLAIVALIVALTALFPAGGSSLGPIQLQDVCACGSANWVRFWDWQQGHWDCWDMGPAGGGAYIHGC